MYPVSCIAVFFDIKIEIQLGPFESTQFLVLQLVCFHRKIEVQSTNTRRLPLLMVTLSTLPDGSKKLGSWMWNAVVCDEELRSRSWTPQPEGPAAALKPPQPRLLLRQWYSVISSDAAAAAAHCPAALLHFFQIGFGL